VNKRELAAWSAAVLLAVALVLGNCLAWQRWTRSGSTDDSREVRELERIQLLIREKDAAKEAGDADRAAELSQQVHKAIDDLTAYRKAHR
jgi:hypothetical protein